MNIHRCGKSDCEIALKPFKNIFPGSKFTTQLLQKLLGNGYINDTINPQTLDYRLQCEETLRTVYP